MRRAFSFSKGRDFVGFSPMLRSGNQCYLTIRRIADHRVSLQGKDRFSDFGAWTPSRQTLYSTVRRLGLFVRVLRNTEHAHMARAECRCPLLMHVKIRASRRRRML